MKKSLSRLILLQICLTGITSVPAQQQQQEINFSEHKCLPGYGFKKMGNPEIFQGNKQKKNYFEGWYFKMVAPNGSSILSIIPGISISCDGKQQHAFIQIIDGITAATCYYTFPIEEFAFSRKEFAIRIGANYFSKDLVILDIRSDSSTVSGEIHMSAQVEFPSNRIINPGIMGWYRFVPFMQCYHGVVSLRHNLEGEVVKDGRIYNFDSGVGYIEKDWGSSMPSAWIWMQSNNFNSLNSSFMLSVANIPWLGDSFTGFLGFFLHEDTLYRFATYTHAKLEIEESGFDTLRITIYDKKNTLLLQTYRNNSGLLRAPVKGSMDRRIPESIDANIQIIIRDQKANVIFCDSTSIAGLEIVGDQEILTGQLKQKK
jgi:tocopherol cyclase